jgi:hypothetical protein
MTLNYVTLILDLYDSSRSQVTKGIGNAGP